MNETFYVRRSERNVGILCLLFFTAMLVLSIYLGMTDVVPAMRIWWFCMTIGVWGGMDLLSLWGLLAYWREKLVVFQHHLTAVGVLSTKEIDLTEVIVPPFFIPLQIWIRNMQTEMIGLRYGLVDKFLSQLVIAVAFDFPLH